MLCSDGVNKVLSRPCLCERTGTRLNIIEKYPTDEVTRWLAGRARVSCLVSLADKKEKPTMISRQAVTANVSNYINY